MESCFQRSSAEEKIFVLFGEKSLSFINAIDYIRSFTNKHKDSCSYELYCAIILSRYFAGPGGLNNVTAIFVVRHN